MEQDGMREAGQEPKLPVKAHWTERPGTMFAAVIATRFLLMAFIVAVALVLPSVLNWNTVMPARAYVLLDSAMQLIVALAAGWVFYRWVRSARRKHGLGTPLSFQTGAAFWAGLVLLLGYNVLVNLEYMKYDPATAAAYFLNMLAHGFTTTLLLVLLFPVLEGRFGIVRSALLLCAANVLLHLVQRFIVYGINEISLAQQEQFDAIVRNDLLYSLLPHSLGSAARAALGVLAYLVASRRLPGAWLLYMALGDLMSLAANKIIIHMPVTNGIDRVQTDLLAQPAFYLAVLGLALLGLAAFERWKSWKDFAGSVKRTAEAVITMGGDEQ